MKRNSRINFSKESFFSQDLHDLRFYFVFHSSPIRRQMQVIEITLRKRVFIRSFSGPYFHAFGLNRERCSVSLRIQSKCGKTQTRKTANTDTITQYKPLKLNHGCFKDLVKKDGFSCLTFSYSPLPT